MSFRIFSKISRHFTFHPLHIPIVGVGHPSDREQHALNLLYFGGYAVRVTTLTNNTAKYKHRTYMCINICI